MLEDGMLYLFIIAVVFLTIVSIVLFVCFMSKLRKARHAEKRLEKLAAECREAHQRLLEADTAVRQMEEKNSLLKEAKDKAEKLAFTDYLTDLPNRAAFMEVLETTMLTLRSHEVVAVIGVDIDHFKKINDSLGSTYGDQILIDIANRLIDVLDENDFIARTGGDEFTVLSQNMEHFEEYEEKLHKIRKIFSYPFSVAGKEVFITVSMGITAAPSDGKNAQVLMKNIQAALLAAKAEGISRYVHFDASINEMLAKRLEMQSELRRALDEGQFQMLYQPVRNINTREIKGFEALLRWNHPQKGRLLPEEFLNYAEDSWLMVSIGNKMMKESCRQMAVWHKEQEGLKLFLNLSIGQFQENDLVQDMVRILEETGIDPKCVELEITEKTALEDMDYTIRTIEALHRTGISVALDDYGTGSSSFSLLKKLSVDSLKIDQSLIAAAAGHAVENHIFEACIRIAQDLDMAVYAEGIEDADLEGLIQKAGCYMAQGFLYGAPMPPEEAGRLLDAGTVQKETG